MKWNEVIIVTDGEAVEAISEMFLEFGAKGVAIENPDDIKAEIFKEGSLDYADDEFLEKLGTDAFVKGYFSEDYNIEDIKVKFKEKLAEIKEYLNIGKGKLKVNVVDDKDWENEWKKYYKTFNITDNIIIEPSWKNGIYKDNQIVIKMDPGMAFGTGTHETTSMCAKLLEKYLKKGDSVLDIGCGSGILSIIASVIGADKILAFDIDNIAIKVSNENIITNNVEKNITLKCGILEDISIDKYNIVVANVISDVIIDLSKKIKNYIKKESFVIVSGIIKDRKQEVIRIYEELGYIMEEYSELGEWVAIVFKCQSFL
jgi:ribosomal protein L11 methyltransferase